MSCAGTSSPGTDQHPIGRVNQAPQLRCTSMAPTYVGTAPHSTREPFGVFSARCLRSCSTDSGWASGVGEPVACCFRAGEPIDRGLDVNRPRRVCGRHGRAGSFRDTVHGRDLRRPELTTTTWTAPRTSQSGRTRCCWSGCHDPGLSRASDGGSRILWDRADTQRSDSGVSTNFVMFPLPNERSWIASRMRMDLMKFEP